MAEANGNGERPRIIQGTLTLGSLINLGAIIVAAVTATLYVAAIKADVAVLRVQLERLDQDVKDMRGRLEARP